MSGQNLRSQNRPESRIPNTSTPNELRPPTPQANLSQRITGLFRLKNSSRLVRSTANAMQEASSITGEHAISISAGTNDQLSPFLPSAVPEPMRDVVNTPIITTSVDAEREAASGAVSSMTLLGPVQNAVATDESSKLVISLLKSLNAFGSVVDKIATIHPYAQAAWTVLSLVSKIINIQTSRDKNVYSLLSKMNEVYTCLTQQELRDIESMKTLVATICKQTLECSYFIQRYAQDAKFRFRFLKNLLSDADERVATYNDVFDELLQQFHNKATGDTLVVVHRIWKDLKTHATGFDLDSMPYVSGAGLDTGKICLEDTRREILGEITDWINRTDDNTPRIFWLHGSAGTGKSSIAHTIADRFKKLGRLGSCYCFDRNKLAEQRDKKIFTIIARDLADWDIHIRNALADVIRVDASLKHTMDIVQQWKEMILKPARKLSEGMVGPIVIIIDALDESGSPTSRDCLLHILSGKGGKGIDEESHITKLPPNVRILLTSRPLPDIAKVLANVRHVVPKSMDSIPHLSTEGDILRYVSCELSDLEGIDIPKVSSDLARGSDGLFEWARLACAFIKDDNMGGLSVEERFESVLTRKKDDLLDSIYTLTLETIFPQSNLGSIGLRRFRSVMAQIIATTEPLPLTSLGSMRCYFSWKEFDVGVIIKPMGALLSGTTDPSSTIRPLHTSFLEFLTDKSRSGEFYVDSSGIHDELAFASLGVMKEQLRFNMCELPSSYLRNSEVPELAERIKENISPELSYSCRFWTDHLKRTHVSSVLAKEVGSFFNHERLLFWFEVLSLEKKIITCISSLSFVLEWAKSNPGCQDIYDDAVDAQKFIQMFGGAISLSTPHLYVSALPFSPKRARISSKFTEKFSKILRISQGHNVDWPVIQGVLRGHREAISSVAFSPDGSRIMSGSFDTIIRLWGAETGEQQPPLEGHRGWVRSVAFSPDGKCILSGSADKTIRLWDAETGEQVQPPLEGHRSWVESVVFSPDGKRIASGSDDKTIRLWDAGTGEQLRPPLEGHQGSVQSVAFSPNSKRLASGSDDKTIRLWDAETGELLRPPLEGHQDSIQSVVFSPDGKRIASGSDDMTIRLWDGETGELLQPPLEGHCDLVWSVVFSPDGKRIMSGSSDKTIRLWDVGTGKQLRPPLEGHQNRVLSVVFSPDGKRIVSGSVDRTIRLWDAEAGEQARPPAEGHKDWVLSVRFSPDGKYIVSGSRDKTIRLWDAKTGEQLQPPLEGHQDWVRSVVFSPDGKRVVSGSDDKTIRLWDAENGGQLWPPFEGHQGPVQSVEFSPDGKRIVSGSSDKTIRLWDAETRELLQPPLEGHYDSVRSVMFSPNGKHIVSGSSDRTIRLWDAETGAQLRPPLKGHQHWVKSVVFSPDGKHIVSGSYDQTIRLWDADTGELIRPPLEGHQGWVCTVAFSSDGKHIVSGSADKTIRLWDAETGEQLQPPLEGHQGQVWSIVLSPDGKHIVSGSDDKTIRLWDVDIGKQPRWLLRGQHLIRFSSQIQHALCEPFELAKQIKSSPSGQLKDLVDVTSLGWACGGPLSRLLFWAPPTYHPQWYPSNTRVAFPPPDIQLDLSNMAHGSSWDLCYNSQAINKTRRAGGIK